MKRFFVIFLCLSLFSVGLVFAQEVIQDEVQKEIIIAQEEIASASSFVKQDDLVKFQQDSILQLADINFNFLTLCVVVIIGLGGIFGGMFYLFNVSPLEKRISKTEKDLEDKIVELINEYKKERLELEKNTKEEIEVIKTRFLKDIKDMQITVEEQNKEIKQQNKEINKQIQSLEIIEKWDRHSIWQAKSNYINVVSSLTSGLQLIIKYKENRWLSLFIPALDKAMRRLGENKYPNKEALYNKIINILDKIEDFEEEKKRITKNAKINFEQS